MVVVVLVLLVLHAVIPHKVELVEVDTKVGLEEAALVVEVDLLAEVEVLCNLSK